MVEEYLDDPKGEYIQDAFNMLSERQEDIKFEQLKKTLMIDKG